MSEEMKKLEHLKPYHVVGNLINRGPDGLPSYVIIDLSCNDLSEAREVLIARLGVYVDLHILDPDGKRTK